MKEKQTEQFAKYLKYSSEKLSAGRAIPEILIEEINQKILSFNQDKTSAEVSSVLDLMKEYQSENPDQTKIETGFKDLDDINGGLHPSLIVLGARPGMGKTAFLLSLIQNVASKGNKVAFVILEMAPQQVVRRINLMNDGEANEEAFKNIAVIDPRSFDIHSITRILTEYHRTHAPKLLVIDYLQMLTLGGYSHHREREISYISRKLKELSRTLEVPIIVSSQLSRAVETRGGEKRPQLSDLRESGAIEQDADMVWFLYRPAYYGIMEDEEGNPADFKGELILAKNKFGGLDTIELIFHLRTTRFLDKDKTGSIPEYTSFQKMFEDQNHIVRGEKFDEGEAPF